MASAGAIQHEGGTRPLELPGPVSIGERATGTLAAAASADGTAGSIAEFIGDATAGC